MNWTVTITREAPDKLSKVEWYFALHSNRNHVALELLSYSESERLTRRHGYNVIGMWNVLGCHRDSRPSPPDDVIAEARQKLNDALVIM